MEQKLAKLAESLNLNDKQMMEIREAFTMFDTNGDGSINVRELGTVMRSLGENPTEAELKDLISEIDADGSGTINLYEFTNLMGRKYTGRSDEDDVREAFKVFDKDGDGFVTFDEVKAVLLNMGENLTDEEFEDLFHEIDLDGNGKIDYEEFEALMSPISRKKRKLNFDSDSDEENN
ncbi:neo-calmodulin-like [Teleopsis dalmanni]|uniref:neo-calmodulin-like n=1 Tax=Teleopsis dalmanni TaxID=139649 RepID=UPI0018CDDA40|nr:neo-calmodulin-like [Teleopsis dalmanni]